jgi:hypothetical protein
MPTPPHPNVKQCTHIKANGIRCGSPAMKNQYFCFFHTQLIKGVPRRVDARIGPLSMLEDADAIQVSIMDVMQEIRQESIDCHRASLLVKLLHLAYRNVKNVTFEKASTKRNAVREMPNYAAQFLAEHPEFGPPLESFPPRKTLADLQRELIAPPAKASPPPPQDAPPPAAPNTTANSSDPPPDSPHASKSPSLLSALQACMAAKPEISAGEPRKIAAQGVRRESNRNDIEPHSVEGKSDIDRELAELLRHVAAVPTNLPRKPGQSRSAHKKDERRHKRELRNIRRAVKALPGAFKGNWRDLRTAFEFAGIFPKKNGANRHGT